MQIPKRKPGKYANQEQDLHITRAKFDELTRGLEKLKKTTRPYLIEEVKRLALLGDFSENFEYQNAKGRLRGINNKILETEYLLAKAIIIELGKNGIVQLGSSVSIEISGKQKTFLILGSKETDPSKGIISHNSPIGSALIGRRVGDIVKIYLADKEIECRITKIL
ncbi:MAG: GreA/GreB family elongation factor [bacterium]